MKWLGPRTQVVLALLALLGSAKLLYATCATDECTSVVLRTPSGGNWCKEYVEEENALYLRSTSPDGGCLTLYPNYEPQIHQRDRQTCSSCDCSAGSMRECRAVSGWTGTQDPVNKFYCGSCDES